MDEEIKLWEKIKSKSTNRQMISDVNWLAHSWERAIKAIPCCSKSTALQIFYELIGAYCRGEGNRNRKDAVSSTAFTGVLVMTRIFDEDYPDAWFPTITQLELNRQEGFEHAIKEWQDA